MRNIVTTTLTLLSTIVAAAAQQETTIKYISLDSFTNCPNPTRIFNQSPQSADSLRGVEKFKHEIRLYPEIKHQTMQGIGGCFNEIGGEALLSLDKDQQLSVMESLFGSNYSNFSICRASIGSSDFGIDAYSFSEVAEDYSMKHFSLEREMRYMLPYIKFAKSINADFKLFGSPWSPPAWMKESGYMDRGNEFRETNRLKDNPQIYEAYALYFLKYVEGYRKEGVTVDRILIQNEQDFNTKYPSCRLPAEQMAKFVSGYMRPLFDKKRCKTEIWAGTFRTRGEREALRIASNEEYRKDFDGIGIQYMYPQYISELQVAAKSMPIMHTESVCFNGKNDLSQARSRFGEVAGYINGGCDNFSYWNMILNESSESGWGWRQNSLITIDRTTKVVTYNPDYAPMMLLSQAIRPGDIRIASYSHNKIITLDAGDKYRLILQNDTEKSESARCYIGEREYRFNIPAQSLCVVEIVKE
ncbi:MAG: hypothetical protein R3Y68_04770 [Rikenellaceae bacterium]